MRTVKETLSRLTKSIKAIEYNLRKSKPTPVEDRLLPSAVYVGYTNSGSTFREHLFTGRSGIWP